MLKTLRVMLVPNKKQKTRLFQFAGTARFAYNWALDEEKKNHEAGGKFINDYELRKRFTVFKQEADNKWLYTISNNVCKQAVKDAVDAYQRFFKGLSKHPKHKSRKRSKPSFYVDPVKIKFTGTHVKLENIAGSKKKNRQSANWFRLAEHDRIPIDAKYFNPHVSFDGLNWFLTVGIETADPEPLASSNDGIGIDLGVKDLAICSSGLVYKNINKTSRVRRLKKKQRRLQRKISRKYEKNKKGESYQKTRNIIKSEKQLLRLTHRLTDIRTRDSEARAKFHSHGRLECNRNDEEQASGKGYTGAKVSRVLPDNAIQERLERHKIYYGRQVLCVEQIMFSLRT